MKGSKKTALWFWMLSLMLIATALGTLFIGSVKIPAGEILKCITGQPVDKETWRVIIMEARLPMIATSMLAGAALAIAGLLLQTTFNNPLAGPSILGVSSGASLGVAVVLLAMGGTAVSAWGTRLSALVGAVAGAVFVLLLLLLFSRIVKSTTMLLIVGIMLGYFASSGISLLNFFSTQEGVHSFVIWGLGNFTGVSLAELPLFATLILCSIFLSLTLIKPLNALLLGSRYAVNVGVNVTATRNYLLLISGVLTAVVTAFCGPIGFVGIIVPHIARLIFGTAHHGILIPATALTGALITVLCSFISVLPMTSGVIPINAITPIIGAPVILYIIINRNKLYYFN